MPTLTRTAALLLLLLLAAAGPAAAAGRKLQQADYRFPPQPAEFDDDVERGFVGDILRHHEKASIAHQAGKAEEARTEWADEAKALVEFNTKFPSNDFRVNFRYNAAKFYVYARRPGDAAVQAELVLRDERANEVSKALGSHLAAYAWLQAAQEKQRAGALPPIKLPYANQRQGRPVQPTMPPGEWKHVVEATDAYLQHQAADPEASRPPAERLVPVPTAELALSAAMVEYAFDNLEDARGRLAKVLSTWADDADVVDRAAELYLQTFLVLGDVAGGQAAAEKLKGQVTASAAKATDPHAKEVFAKLGERLARAETSTEFNAATALLEGDQPAKAAAAYEAFLEHHPADPLVPSALNNAALAYDKVAAAAKEPDRAAPAARAVALREQLLARFPDSELAGPSMLRLADAANRAGKVEEAVKLLGAYLERYPQGQARCAVLNDLGASLDRAKRPLDAAARYLEFAHDQRCRAEDVNGTGRLLYRAADLYTKAKKDKEAREALTALVGLDGSVTDVVVKSYISDAKKRLKGK